MVSFLSGKCQGLFLLTLDIMMIAVKDSVQYRNAVKTMMDECKALFHQLQEDLSHCKNKLLPFEQEVECCFQVTERYWRRLQQNISKYVFRNSDEQIEFFRDWKPKFTSEIEYYNLLYHAILFRPRDIIAAIRFWRREAGRLEKFKNENYEFYVYYKFGGVGKDDYYFLPENCDPQLVLEAKVYDADLDLLTNGDYLITSLLALERYSEYVQTKLKSLT